MTPFQLRPLQSGEEAAIAELVFHSTNSWYEERTGSPIFQGSPEDCLIFPEVYESLDPGCCLVAEDTESGRLIGSCFWRERETHCALGIMNTDP
ncbi:MAG: N-acetyltransferase, partial [Planctomycetota bacterium]